jgi:hypothetical protein
VDGRAVQREAEKRKKKQKANSRISQQTSQKDYNEFNLTKM